jgi:anti-sigma factor RsiW
MKNMECSYSQTRDDVLVEYLYGEMDAGARQAFTAHLSDCAVCRTELSDLRGVQAALQQWAPPEPNLGAVPIARRAPMFGHDETRAANQADLRAPARWWRDIPAWAQVAAALLVLGVSAGLANLDVRYSGDGLVIQTGWSRSAAPTADASAPWRADLAALEQELRAALETTSATAASPVAAPAKSGAPPVDGEALLRRVRTMIEQSEQRGQREMALRIGQLARDVDLARQEDLVRISSNLGQIQNRATRTQQIVDYMQKVSLQR